MVWNTVQSARSKSTFTFSTCASVTVEITLRRGWSGSDPFPHFIASPGTCFGVKNRDNEKGSFTGERNDRNSPMEHLCIVSMRIPHKGGICNLLFKILELWFSFAAAVCDILQLQTLSIKKLLCALRFVGFAANELLLQISVNKVNEHDCCELCAEICRYG